MEKEFRSVAKLFSSSVSSQETGSSKERKTEKSKEVNIPRRFSEK